MNHGTGTSNKDKPTVLQQPKLPDIEATLHVVYAEVISTLDKKLADDAELPCISCERLHQRNNVTAFKFSEG